MIMDFIGESYNQKDMCATYRVFDNRNPVHRFSHLGEHNKQNQTMFDTADLLTISIYLRIRYKSLKKRCI
jgi:hypothetical protein